MFVAAMLDARPDLEARVMADVAAVLPPQAGWAVVSTGVSGGIAVRRLALVPPGESTAAVAPGGRAAHDHAHGYGDHGHGQGPNHDHRHDHGHSHDHLYGPSGGALARPIRYPDMVEYIRAARLSPGTAEVALALLKRLAEAESEVHRAALEAVHFHELADWDSLMDLVAAASIVAALTGAVWSVSDLPLGRGLVRTQHGLLPVPAPATTLLLRGFPLRDDGTIGEAVTPTGAAILAQVVDPRTPVPIGGRLVATGIGAGTRELPDRPNVLRALLFDTGDGPSAPMSGRDAIVVIGFDVDDMTGEEIGVAVERLRAAAGVLDVSLGQRLGKKSRPLTEFRLLVRPDCLEAVADLCLDETSTIGLRWHREDRRVLARRTETVADAGGHVRRKCVVRPDGTTTAKVECDDLVGLDGLERRRGTRRRLEGGLHHDPD